MTQSVDDVCKRSQMNVAPTQRTRCFVGRANRFICGERNINGIAAAGFADEMQKSLFEDCSLQGYLFWHAVLNTFIDSIFSIV